MNNIKKETVVMDQHQLISTWGIKKYNLPEGTKVSVESDRIQSGYCDTCYYEEEVVRVYADGKEIDTLYDMDLASLLNMILAEVFA